MSQTTEKTRWMIYGANGYTGALIARMAKAQDLCPILAGRSADKIVPLAKELGFESRIFTIDSPQDIEHALNDVSILLLTAGPFEVTSSPFVEACIVTNTHYLDITGEFNVFETIFSRGKDAPIALIPGVGMDVVPSDCLSHMLKSRLESATHLQLSIVAKDGSISPGTAKTLLNLLPRGLFVRKDGQIVNTPYLHSAAFEHPGLEHPIYGEAIPWGDVSTAYHSTGIPNISVYFQLGDGNQSRMKGWLMSGFRYALRLSLFKWMTSKLIEQFITGPTAEENETSTVTFGGIAWDNQTGQSVSGLLQTVAGYRFTAISAIKAVQKLQTSHKELHGALTPSLAFGEDFVLGIDDTKQWEFVEGFLSPQQRQAHFPF